MAIHPIDVEIFQAGPKWRRDKPKSNGNSDPSVLYLKTINTYGAVIESNINRDR